MSYQIVGGTTLLLLAALWMIRSGDDMRGPSGRSKSAVVEAVTREDGYAVDPSVRETVSNELKDSMAVTGLNNPRSDLTQNTAVDRPEQSYAGVDPTRHRADGVNPQEAGGDSAWVTETGEDIVGALLKGAEEDAIRSAWSFFGADRSRKGLSQ